MKYGSRFFGLLVAVVAGALLVLILRTAHDREVRIGFVSHQHDITDLFGQLEIGFREALDKAGVKYKMFQAAPSQSNRHDEMLNILENMANLRLDYLAFGPSSLRQNTPGLVAVANSGARILMLDYEPNADEEYPFEDAVLNWSVYSHGEMGYETGKWIVKHFKDQGNNNPKIIMMWGPVASEISQARGNGVMRAFEEAKGFEANIIYHAYANFERELAFAETERALIAYPQVEVIVGINSNMALGIMSALEANPGALDRIVVTGMGGQSDEMEMVARGKLGVTIFRDPRNMGANSARALLMDLQGKRDQIEKVVYTPLRTIDSADAVRQYVPRAMLDIDAALAR
jgi:ABC-type sugar transport system substrate-binding protein